MAQSVGNGVDLSSYFGPADILCHTQHNERDALLRALVYRLASNHEEIGDPEGAFRAVLEREQAEPTLMPSGVAVPHARLATIQRPFVAVATHREGVPFGGSAQRRVQVVVLLLVPKDQPGLYLQILRSLAGLLREESAPAALTRLETPDEIMRYLKHGGLVLPDYVCAADIMAPPPATLKENDSLKTAIDMFVNFGLTEIPVVDADGELVGVVSATALLHVCLPDYLLWMDDLSPIRNFQPFSAVLRNEANTWLGEIMSEQYAFVQMHSPAIEVAAEFSRRNTTLCYVLQQKRLVGLVNLQHFLDKVLRE